MFGVIRNNPAIEACIAALILMVAGLFAFAAFEPVTSQAVTATDQFTVSQQVTAEIAFSTTANNVTMSPSIGGLTGGTANGATQVVVKTNNSAGYTMTIDFASSSYGTAAMNQNGGSAYINDYAPATPGTPDYTFSNGTAAQLAYTVVASTSSDVDPTFLSDGTSNCATGSTNNPSTCWMGPAQAAETIISRSTPTPVSGSTSTIQFRVGVPSNPNPVVSSGYYTATATLTAVTS